MNIRLMILCSLMLAGGVQAASTGTLPNVTVNAKHEKQNATLNIDRAATAGLSNKDTLDGLVGVTADFPGGEMPVYVVFDPSVAEETVFSLAEFQGRIKGSLQCKRIRAGSSPKFPNIKMAVLAEQCTIKSLQH